MEPAAPGKPRTRRVSESEEASREGGYVPLMTTANTAKPSYRLTNMSSTIPVPLLMIIAPKSGLQPSFNRGFTRSFFNVYTRQLMARHTTSALTTKGMGVWRYGTRRVETKPRRMRVKRSPRQDATAGAMLSGFREYLRQRTTMVHIREPRMSPEREAAVIAEQATMINLENKEG